MILVCWHVTFHALPRGTSSACCHRGRSTARAAIYCRISKDERSGYSRDGVELVPAEADAIRDGVRRVLAGESVYAITKSWQASVPPVPYGT